jgi:hypothetical protein
VQRRRWKFGVGQSAAEEQREIAAALAAGRGDEYLRGQTFERMRERELERRRSRHPGRRAPESRGARR